MTYLKGFLLGIALWLGVLLLVLTGLRTDDNRLLLLAAAVILVFLLTWRRLWRRRRRLASNRVPIPTSLRRHIYARDGYQCVYCDRKGRHLRLTIDHVHPVVLGGTNDPGNLVTACRACNLTKGARLLNDAGLRRFTEERHAWAGRKRRRGCLLRVGLYQAVITALTWLIWLLIQNGNPL